MSHTFYKEYTFYDETGDEVKLSELPHVPHFISFRIKRADQEDFILGYRDYVVPEHPIGWQILSNGKLLYEVPIYGKRIITALRQAYAYAESVIASTTHKVVLK